MEGLRGYNGSALERHLTDLVALINERSPQDFTIRGELFRETLDFYLLANIKIWFLLLGLICVLLLIACSFCSAWCSCSSMIVSSGSRSVFRAWLGLKFQDVGLLRFQIPSLFLRELKRARMIFKLRLLLQHFFCVDKDDEKTMEMRMRMAAANHFNNKSNKSNQTAKTTNKQQNSRSKQR